MNIDKDKFEKIVEHIRKQKMENELYFYEGFSFKIDNDTIIIVSLETGKIWRITK